MRAPLRWPEAVGWKPMWKVQCDAGSRRNLQSSVSVKSPLMDFLLIKRVSLPMFRSTVIASLLIPMGTAANSTEDGDITGAAAGVVGLILAMNVSVTPAIAV